MTEREALRLLHLDEGCSQEQLRRAYRDLVKVWHPDRFQSDAQLRAKAERTLQSINEAYALLQSRTTSPASASASTDSDNEPESATARPDYRAAAGRATAAKGRAVCAPSRARGGDRCSGGRGLGATRNCAMGSGTNAGLGRRRGRSGRDTRAR